MGFNAVLTFKLATFDHILAPNWLLFEASRSAHSLLLEVWSKSPTLEVIEAAVWQRHIEGGNGNDQHKMASNLNRIFTKKLINTIRSAEAIGKTER